MSSNTQLLVDTGESQFYVFAYGSLMWDHWERKLWGSCVGKAVLPGYRRCLCVLDKSGRWGNPEHPGLVMGLVHDTAAGVEGTLFAFPAEQRPRVESYLRDREGPTHPLVLTAVHFEDSSVVHEILALVAINDSNTEYFVDSSTREERVKMLRCSGGSAGTGLDYLFNLADHLSALGIRDSEIDEFVRLADTA